MEALNASLSRQFKDRVDVCKHSQAYPQVYFGDVQSFKLHALWQDLRVDMDEEKKRKSQQRGGALNGVRT